MKKKKPNTKVKILFKKFKKVVETHLGDIKWGKVGIFAVALLLFVATKGLLGPEAQIIAYGIIKFSAYA